MKNIFPVLVIIVLLLAGCSSGYTHILQKPTSPPTAAEISEFENAKARFYDESTGKVITDASDIFDFKIEKWEVGKGKDEPQNNITLSVVLWNKSGEFLKNVDVAFKWHEEGVRIIGNGLDKVDSFEPVDLYGDRMPAASAYSIEYTLTPVSEPANKGLDAEYYLDRLSDLTVLITVGNTDYEVNIDLGPIKYLNEITY